MLLLSDKQTQEDLSCLFGVWVIDDDASAETSLLSYRRDKLDLVVGCRVELENGSGGVFECGVEGGEETGEAMGWGGGGMRGFGVEKPLQDRYTEDIFSQEGTTERVG